MTTMTTIRPGLQSLQCLPTLHQIAEAWGRLELKLQTNDTRYWVTTEGVPEKTTGAPVNYVVGYVTVEKLAPDGRWDLKAVYSPDAWKLSQGFDYCHLLSADLRRLEAELQDHFSWDTVREIEEVEQELKATNRVIRELSKKIRTTWS
jgi:hypothetical protein